MAGLIVP